MAGNNTDELKYANTLNGCAYMIAIAEMVVVVGREGRVRCRNHAQAHD